jgi:hypothetical protein
MAASAQSPSGHAVGSRDTIEFPGPRGIPQSGIPDRDVGVPPLNVSVLTIELSSMFQFSCSSQSTVITLIRERYERFSWRLTLFSTLLA